MAEASADWGPKDPDAIRDYGIDWSGDIGATTIAASTWAVVSGTVEIDDDSFTDTTVTARFSGGTAGETCVVTNHVTFANGEEDDWTKKLKIKER